MSDNKIFIADADEWLSSDYAQDGSYDVVYIDPPYDTGTSFSYNDSRGDWPEFMERKLVETRRVMKDDGVLFISLDDNRLVDLCFIGDQVFGRKNRIAIMVTHQSQRSNTKLVNIVHEYVIVYAKNKAKAHRMSIRRIDKPDGQEIIDIQDRVSRVFKNKGKEAAVVELKSAIKAYRNKNPENSWIVNYRTVDDEGNVVYPKDLSVPGEPNSLNIPEIGLHLSPLETRRWSSPVKFKDLHRQKRLFYLGERPYEKHLLLEAEDSIYSLLPFYSRQGTEDLKRLDIGGLFDTPKPVAMIEFLIESCLDGRTELKVLDYFAGSGTTAQAVFSMMRRRPELNISFTLVQLDEPMREGSTPAKTARRLGIEPRIPLALKYRIDKFIDTGDGTEEYDWNIVEDDCRISQEPER